MIDYLLPEGFSIPAFLTSKDIEKTLCFSEKVRQLLLKKKQNISNIIYLRAEKLSSDLNTLLTILEGADGIELPKDSLTPKTFQDVLRVLPESCSIVRMQAKHLEEVRDLTQIAQAPFTIFFTLDLEKFVFETKSDLYNVRHKLFGIEPSPGVSVKSLATEIAELLTKVRHAIDICTKYGISPNQIVQNLHIKTTVGSRFLAEIAKLRSLRFLVSELLLKTFPTLYELPHIHIHAETIPQLRTGNDAYTNMLSNTVQTMAAVCGGADSITTLPYDFFIDEKSSFSDRITKNTLLLLKEEGQVLQPQDSTSGAYYMEYLSYNMAQKAWELFTDSLQ